jgi:hypothetical protein
VNEQSLAIRSTILMGIAAFLGGFAEAGRALMALVCVVMFLAGTVLMAMALVIASRRSRESVITIGEIFFRVPKPFLYCFGAQVVIAFASAAAHPNTGAAFGILAPVFGLGIMGLWGARHGQFPARDT